MTARAEIGGIAARLINRAEGRLTALRPSLPRYFGAEQARDAPVMDHHTEVSSDAIAGAAPAFADKPGQPQPTSAQAIERVEERLLPALDRQRPASDDFHAGEPAEFMPQPAELAETAVPESFDPGFIQEQEHARAPASGLASSQRLMADPVTNRRNARQQSVNGDSLAAAITHLLGSDQAESQQSDHGGPPLITAAAAPGPASARAFAQGLPPTARPDSSEPALSIHIGEIVIAPEAGPPSRAERLAAPAWQPPVALAEYRAARARERR